ncbi:MAG: TIGR02281 family clan AA aspartic protease [Pseudomonadota bacterium]
MLFWPLTIIGCVVLVIYVAAHPDIDLGAPKNDELTSLYVLMLVAAIAFAGIARMLLRSNHRTLANSFALTFLGFLAFGGYVFREDVSSIWDRVRGELNPSLALAVAPGEVELRRAWDGHFRADVHINGHVMRMMVDTGASMVIIPFEQGKSLGINPDVLRFSMPVATANGPAKVAPINLDRIEVGPILVRDVIAAVAQEGALDTPLLGMSFLGRLTETSFQGERLILRQSVTDRGAMMLGR